MQRVAGNRVTGDRVPNHVPAVFFVESLSGVCAGQLGDGDPTLGELTLHRAQKRCAVSAPARIWINIEKIDATVDRKPTDRCNFIACEAKAHFEIRVVKPGTQTVWSFILRPRGEVPWVVLVIRGAKFRNRSHENTAHLWNVCALHPE